MTGSPKHIKSKSIAFLVLLLIVLGTGFYLQHYITVPQVQSVDEQQAQIVALQNSVQQLLAQQAVVNAQLQALNAASAPSILSETTYLLQQAEYQLTIQQNQTAALELLALATRRVSMVNSIAFDRLNQAIARDVNTINAINILGSTDLINRFASLNEQIEQLSLFKPVTVTPSVEPEPAKAGDWHQQLLSSLKSLRDVVVIQKTNDLYVPILSTQELGLFKQYLQSILQQALWAALKNDNATYQESLKMALNAIEQKFPQQTTKTKLLKQEIVALLQLNITPFSHVVLSALPMAISLQQSKSVEASR